MGFGGYSQDLLGVMKIIKNYIKENKKTVRSGRPPANNRQEQYLHKFKRSKTMKRKKNKGESQCFHFEKQDHWAAACPDL